MFTHLLVAQTPHVAVVDRSSTTQPPQQVRDGPRCVVCATTVVGPTNVSSSRAREDMKIVAVEQSLPLMNATVAQRLPFADDSVVKDRPLRDTGVVESELPRPEEGEVSSSESSSSETSASSSGSRRLRKSNRNRSGRRRLRRSPADNDTSTSEVINVVEYSEDSPNRVRAIAVANPPSGAATITKLPGLSWKHFLRDLKASEIEQVCLLTSPDPTNTASNAITTCHRRARRRPSPSPRARSAL
jgi:hypothetical protein